MRVPPAVHDPGPCVEGVGAFNGTLLAVVCVNLTSDVDARFAVQLA